MRVYKGHGTENDFVIIPDLEGVIDVTPSLVRALCDRHAGIGGDGILRVIRTENAAEVAHFADIAPFFMDYRNADGSLAEMCGNGVRVFMRYLQATSLVEHHAAVATRGGIVRVRASRDACVSVDMGQPRILADRPVVTAALTSPAAPSFRAVGMAVEMPNPHVVVGVDSADTLAALDLSRKPVVDPALPNDQNVEFMHRAGPRHLVMRVHERGVGETRSCGTGICAVVVAAAEADGVGPDGAPWRVDVPGGTCTVCWRADGSVELTGPAVLVAAIDLDEAWLDRARSSA
jgi:diaminopimelate epimerase